MSIFVRIPSYRDPELGPTVDDCIAKAKYPDDLRFGICWQHDGSESLGALADDPRVHVVEVPHTESKGASWARAQVLPFYDGEDFTICLDAHHRFADGWDTTLMDMMEMTGAEKPVITTYPPDFDPATGRYDRRVMAMAFAGFNPNGPIRFRPAAVHNADELERPFPSRFCAGGFAFTLGRAVEEIPNDPHLYFLGEETNLTVRAYTKGYDFFHPHRVVCWHQYAPPERPTHWDDNRNQKTDTWFELERHGQARLRRLLGIDPPDPNEDFGAYGLGTDRSLRDFEKYAGVNFTVQGVDQWTLDGLPPPTPYPFESEASWIASLIVLRQFDLGLPREDLDWLADAESCSVTLYDESDAEMCATRIPPGTLRNLRNAPDPDLTVSHFTRQASAKWKLEARNAAGERLERAGVTTER